MMPSVRMHQALRLARCAARHGEVPIAALLVDPHGRVTAAAANAVECQGNVLAHAEMQVLDRGMRRHHSQYLSGFALYVTLEPCVMCAGAISLARVSQLYVGVRAEKRGGLGALTKLPHRPEIYDGVAEQESTDLLRAFFRPRRCSTAHP
ncbi:MAG: nucleoside deaminase [Alphaproteobacteria bacterium]|nr:nucleoside deaminase [Alphaproteobacteria bacterium]